MGDLAVLVIESALIASVLLTVRAALQARFRRDLVAWELSFPSGLKPAEVTAFLVGLSGLAGSRWQHRWSGRAVVFEVEATSAGLTHRLLVPKAQAGVVAGALRAHLPSVRVTPLDEVPIAMVTLAAQLGLSNAHRQLNVASPAMVVTGLLSTLQPLGPGESVTLQWVLQPTGPVAAITSSSGGESKLPEGLSGARSLSPEERKAQRIKYANALFLATPRLGVTSNNPAAAKAVLGRVLAAFHTANAPGAHLYRRLLPSRIVGRSLGGRFLPVLVPPCLLNVAELTGLIGIPLGDRAVAGLRLGSSRLLAPSVDINRTGRVVATANFPGAERPLALSVTDSLRHLHVIGPTGVGKSTLLLSLITQDMQAGRGVVVIDPKGDLAADVLDRVPPHRVSDVVVLDPADEAFPVGFNLLAGPAQGSELLVEQLVGTLHSLFKSSWGPRTDDILRSALLTLVGRPGMTLCEVPLLLTDARFRSQLVGQIDDPVALGPFWASYEAWTDAERAAAIGPVLNKLRAFLLRRRLRNVLGQADPPFNMDNVLREGRILVVPLAKGLLGEEAAALLGSLVVARLWQATMARAGQPAAIRRPVMAYIDEVQDFMHLPTDLGDLFAQARGLGLSLTVAHQHLGQLPTALREAVLANARSRVIFQTAAADGAKLAKELTPYITGADLQALGPYEVVASLSTGSRVAPPATGQTLPPPLPTGQAEAARTFSRQHYGQPREAVEAAIRARHQGQTPDAPVGRRAARP